MKPMTRSRLEDGLNYYKEGKLTLEETLNGFERLIEDELKEEYVRGEKVALKINQYIENKFYNKAIDDAINWFGEELDRLVRTKQIDMIHTNIDKIISDAENELKEEK